MKMAHEEFFKNIFSKSSIPRWVPIKGKTSIPIYVKAVKPVGCNLWHLQRLAITQRKRKYKFFGPTMGLLEWAQIDNYQFLNQRAAENFATVIIANNGNTAKHLESDIFYSKVLDFTNANV